MKKRMSGPTKCYTASVDDDDDDDDDDDVFLSII
jgi:hypothetical protein